MNIPKYINRLITRRAELAKDLNTVDCKLSNWIDKYNISLETYDFRGGWEMYVNPDDSAKRIRQAISTK